MTAKNRVCTGCGAPAAGPMCRPCHLDERAARDWKAARERMADIVTQLAIGIPPAVVADDLGIKPLSLARRLERHGYREWANGIRRAEHNHHRGVRS